MIHLISPRPLLMIAGTEAATAYLSREAIGKAQEPKELFSSASRNRCSSRLSNPVGQTRHRRNRA